MTDTRPINCRNRLRDELKPYPKSGCASCRDGGLRGCPHEPRTPAKPAPAINRITERDVVAMKLEASFDGNALDLYQKLSSQSAVYPGRDTALGLIYVALKLAGEAGEVSEKVGKAMRDDHFLGENHALTPERRAALIKELGDVLWYVAAAARELDVSLSEVAVGNLEKLAGRSDRGTLQGSGDDR